jgi:hypothetical protein
MFRSSRARSLTCAAVAALFLWLTSVDCLACCLLDQLAAKDGCEATTRLACCEEPGDARNAPGASAGLLAAEQATAICPLLTTSYGDSETPRPLDLDHALAPSTVTPPVDVAGPAPLLPPSRVANRGDTYLRCRVLLI